MSQIQLVEVQEGPVARYKLRTAVIVGTGLEDFPFASATIIRQKGVTQS